MGDEAGGPCTARHWLAALDRAGNRQFPNGAQGPGVCLLRANGGQPTAVAFRQAWTTLGLQHACTSDHPPQGKADTERMMRPLTEECVWLQAWTSPAARMRALATWMAYDNNHDLHSALGYKTPRPFEPDDPHSHCTPFVAA